MPPKMVENGFTPPWEQPELIKALLSWIGRPPGRTGRPAGIEKPPTVELKPIALLPSQRTAVEQKITEFLADWSSIYAYARDSAAKANALPLYFDWSAFMALRPNG